MPNPCNSNVFLLNMQVAAQSGKDSATYLLRTLQALATSGTNIAKGMAFIRNCIYVLYNL